MRRADYQIWSGQPGVLPRFLDFSDPEVKHLYPVSFGDIEEHNIVALQIAMDYVFCMCGLQRSAYLSHDFDNALEWKRARALYDLFQSPAKQEFHHKEDYAVFGFTEISNANR